MSDERRCPEGYGRKSLRLLKKAKERGMRINANGDIVLPTGKIHDPKPQDGRRRFNLSIDGERCSVQTARVICFLTHGEPDDPMKVADHIDGNPENDDPQNLRWASYSENLRNSRENRESQKRIAACVAACAGIPTEQLEAGCVKRLMGAFDLILSEVKKQICREQHKRTESPEEIAHRRELRKRRIEIAEAAATRAPFKKN